MTTVIRSMVDGYTDLMDNKSDPRVKDWFLMSGPFPTIAMCLGYVYIVKVLGPKLMENRKPFELKYTLIVYNAIQVIISAWIFKEGIYSGWFTTYSFICEPVDYSNNPQALRMAATCYWYHLSKYTEFFDTIFFVMRKKYNQVNKLHVIHHGIMPLSTWFGVKFLPGGHGTLFGVLNTFVHIVMYTYYMLAAFGPHMQKYLWWKKYLTVMQMVQFIIVMVHAFQLLFIDCNYPKIFVWWIGLQAILFLSLFKDFYNQAYKKRKTSSKDEGPAVAVKTSDIQETNSFTNNEAVRSRSQTKKS